MTESVAVRTWPDVVPAANRTIGLDVLEWTLDYLLQPDGPNAGQMWEFTREQQRIVCRWYEIDEHGRFLHRRGVLRRMKGWGKDPFLAAIAAVELCGPCRFGGWDANGMPVGVQHPAPWIQVAAVSRDQTRNTMTLFPGMFSPAAFNDYKIDLGKEIIYARGNGRIEAVTSSPRAIEGGRPSLVIANETHHWLFSNDGLAMADAIRRNLGKSRDGSARVMEITNAHLPGEGSAAELTYEAWRKSSGQIAGVYYDSTESPALEDLHDETAVKDGLRAARGDSTWLNVDRLWEEISDPVTPEGISRRFYLNIVTKMGSDWLPDGAWDACRTGERIPDHAEVVLGFDGSFTGDYTGLVACTVPGPGEVPLLEVLELWIPPPGGHVDVEDVEARIMEECRRFRVREIACDSYRWQRTLEILEKERLPVVDFPQNTQHMTPATTRFREAVINRVLEHSGDDRLTQHIDNCVLKVDSRGERLSKDAKGSPRKIDLAIAAVMAHERACSLANAPDETPGIWSLEAIAAELRAEKGEQAPTSVQHDRRFFSNRQLPVTTFHKM